jgi:tRNA A37 threonylcarbamoyltransferase TsaD
LNDVTCPDIFELSDGRFAVIGTDMTAELDGSLPADAARGHDERIVVITRETLISAKWDIPDR